jgi:hypothetical protein
VGAWIALTFGVDYQSRSGLIALLHRLGMEHRKPRTISRKLDPAKQATFIAQYEALMKRIFADEAVIFADAVHPTTRYARLAAGAEGRTGHSRAD